jgi:hypothetical protein
MCIGKVSYQLFKNKTIKALFKDTKLTTNK